MEESDYLAQQFESHHDHLRAVAYRMLGSVSEADDALQESWLRVNRSDASEIENLGGWLTTIVSRVCLDILRSRKARREEPMGRTSPSRSSAARTRSTPSMRRCSQTRSASRSRWCSTP
jgi:DNA-directed RNA polymerase specialized sigma24 family protein